MGNLAGIAGFLEHPPPPRKGLKTWESSGAFLSKNVVAQKSFRANLLLNWAPQDIGPFGMGNPL